MKYLSHFSQLNYTNNVRVIMANAPGEKLGEFADSLIPSSPLGFGMLEVHKLGQGAYKNLSDREKKNLAGALEYNLAQAQRQDTNASRIITHFFRDPSLNALLSADQRAKIKLLISSEYKKVVELNKTKPEEWSEDQATQAIRVYRIVGRNLTSKALGNEDENKRLKKNLEAYAKAKLEKGIEALGTNDQLLLFEIDRLGKPWEDETFSTKLLEVRQFKKDLKKRLIEGEVITANFSYWELLLEDTDLDVPPEIETFLRTQKQAQSLKSLAQAFNSNQGRVLSLEEYDFLTKLARSAEGLATQDEADDQELKKAESVLETARSAFQKAKEQRESEITGYKRKNAEALKDLLPVGHELQTVLSDPNSIVHKADTALSKEELAAKKEVFEKVYEALLPQNLQAEGLKILETEKSEAEAEINRLASQSRDFKTYVAKAPATAAGVLQEFETSLTDRLKSRQLLTTDVEILTQVAAEDFSSAEVKAKKAAIENVRAQVDKTLGGALGFSLEKSNYSETEITAADQLLTYSQVLNEATQNRDGALAESLEPFNLSEKRAVIEGVLLSIRQRIMSTLDRGNRSSAMENFLAHYERKHKSLQTDERVKDLLYHTNELKREEERTKKRYQESSINIQELFHKGGEAAMKFKLSELLRPELSVDEVFHELEQEVVGHSLVAEYKTPKLERVRTGFKTILEPKVKDRFQAEAGLNLAIENLLENFDEKKIEALAQAGLDQAFINTGEVDKDARDKLGVSAQELRYFRQLAYPTYLEVVEKNESLSNYLETFRASIENDNKRVALSNLDEFYHQNYVPQLKMAVNELESEVNYYFSPVPDRIKEHIEEIKLELEYLGTVMGELFAHNRNVDGYDEGFTKILKILNKVKALFGVDNSELKAVMEANESVRLEHPEAVHAYIKDELGLLGPNGAERAEKEFNRQREQNIERFEQYKKLYQKNRKLMENDIRRLNEKDFADRHKTSKHEARKILVSMAETVQGGEEVISIFNGKDEAWYNNGSDSVFSDWLKDYKNPARHGDALVFMNYFKDWEKSLDEDGVNEKGIKELEKWNSDYKNSKSLIPFKYKKHKITLEWYSLKSIGMTVKFYWESWGKRTQRKNDQMMAELGEKMFGDSIVGREFKKEANDKENERVDFWKASYGSFNVKELQGVIAGINSVKHKDEARAAMELLIDKGELRIDSPIFLNMLNVLSGGKKFNVESDIAGYVENQDGLNRKVGEVFTALWDRPTWIQTKENFESKYVAAMKNHEGDLSAEAFSGAADDYLIRSLVDWEKGEPADDFERAKFEQYIKGAMKDGLMNGYPSGGDRRFFYLIKGLTVKNPNTNDTILGAGAMRRLTELVGKIPYLDALDDIGAHKKDGRIVSADTPGAEKRHWSLDDVYHWAKYFEGVDIGKLNGTNIKDDSIESVVNLRQGVRMWLNECLAPSGDTADRAGKINLREVDPDDTGMLPLVTNPERFLDVLTLDSGENRPVKGDKYYLNLFTSLEKNLTDSVKTMQQVLKHNEPGSGFRKKELVRFGQIIRNYFLMSQTLAGNWDKEHAVGVVTLSDAEWELGEAGKAYEKAIEMISMFTKNADIDRLLKDQRYDDIKVSKNKEAPAEQVKAAALVKTIYEDNIFGDEEALTAFIQEYSAANGLNL